MNTHVKRSTSQNCSDLPVRGRGVGTGGWETTDRRAPFYLFHALELQVRFCLGKPPTSSLLSSLMFHSSPKVQAAFSSELIFTWPSSLPLIKQAMFLPSSVAFHPSDYYLFFKVKLRRPSYLNSFLETPACNGHPFS